MLTLCCIAGTIGLGYATQIATLTIDKCEPAAANFNRHSWVCNKQYFMTQQGQALRVIAKPCFSHSITPLHMPKIRSPAVGLLTI